MEKLYSPRNELELVLLRSLLSAADIPYFVHNDHYGSLKIGPRIELLNAKTVFVSSSHAAAASELLADFLDNSREAESNPAGYSALDKMRMVLESLLFGWFIPGTKRSG